MPNDIKTDSVLIERIRAGDSSAFQSLFNLYADLLLNYVHHYVNDPQICEDIVQELFVKIWLKRKNLKSISSIKSYLYTAVRNGAFQYLRHEKVKQKSEATIKSLYTFNQTPEQKMHEEELTNTIQSAIEELPEKCQMIFKLNRFDGLSYSEIAEVENISVNTVKTQMGRAFKFLRKRLTRYLI